MSPNKRLPAASACDPVMPSGPRVRSRSPRGAFTLTELLVVIAIIGVLTSLVTAAAVSAWNKARTSRITLEIQTLSQAMEQINSDFGIYPPNAMHTGQALNDGPQQGDIANDLNRTFKKLFPRHQESPALIAQIAGASNGLVGGMAASEAIYFWLGGFSDDPKYPISGTGGPSFNISTTPTEVVEDRNRRAEFDLTRLGPRNVDGSFAGRFIQYTVNVNGVSQDRQINFWQYFPKGSAQPLVYFDVSRYKPYQYDMHAASDPLLEVHAIAKLREGVSVASTPADLAFVDQGKYQILHAGLDEDWGNFASLSYMEQGGVNILMFPNGPFTGGLADNLASFTTGTLEQAQP